MAAILCHGKNQTDNFSIIVLELNGSHRRVVYCWTCNRQLMRERLKSKQQANLQSFYICFRHASQHTKTNINIEEVCITKVGNKG